MPPAGTGWRLEPAPSTSAPAAPPDSAVDAATATSAPSTPPPASSLLTYIIQTNLAGWVAAFIYNAAAGGTLGGYFNELRAYLPDHVQQQR